MAIRAARRRLNSSKLGGGGDRPVAYLKYKLDRCFVKSWSTSGDADDRPTEEVAFYYNKIAFAYLPADGGAGETMAWDNVKNVPWTDHGLPTSRP